MIEYSSPRDRATLDARVSAMARTLTHRGPDSGGTWVDPATGVALGHRRLAILDLSPQGHQPMCSADGALVLSFNGEIYNHRELRAELESARSAAPWRGGSDTETLLAGFRHWGLEGTLRRTVGMFALALWDRRSSTLSLARDRMGEKPLYYGLSSGTLLFGSELKALRAHPDGPVEIDRGAICSLLRHGVIHGPCTIYRSILRLPPGTILSLPVGDTPPAELPEPIPWWSWKEVVAAGLDEPFPGDEPMALVALERVLRQSVRGQMVADVPVGAFLSGGIDSSLVVALMQAESSCPVHTFSIGFHEEGFDESHHAAAVAAHLGTDHTPYHLTPDDALRVIPELPRLYDQPFADSSQIPTALVCRMARKEVTVALSGDAGDELFGGYNRYRTTPGIWRRTGWIPGPLRSGLGAGLQWWPDMANAPMRYVLGARLPSHVRHPAAAVRTVGDCLRQSGPEGIYLRLMSQWPDPEMVVIDGRMPQTVYDAPGTWFPGEPLVHRFMAMDGVGYLPEDILMKVDAAAMGISLETRLPLLDHRVVELAWRLPLGMKSPPGGPGKRILRKLLGKYVPRELFERPKMGFGVPIHTWLRGPLKEWAQDLIAPERLRREGYLRPEPVWAAWRTHQEDRADHAQALWAVLMFQAWLAEQPPLEGNG